MSRGPVHIRVKHVLVISSYLLAMTTVVAGPSCAPRQRNPAQYRATTPGTSTQLRRRYAGLSSRCAGRIGRRTSGNASTSGLAVWFLPGPKHLYGTLFPITLTGFVSSKEVSSMSSPEEHPQPRGKFCNKDFLLFFPKPYTLHFFTFLS